MVVFIDDDGVDDRLTRQPRTCCYLSPSRCQEVLMLDRLMVV